jgi:sugar/nucleoside kinase (ribokinase family)
MSNRRFDVLGIGNAIVDILSQSTDVFLENEGISKGTMTLIDEERANTLFKKMATTTVVSGGSAANTMAGIASLGGASAYIGKVFDDQLGAIFGRDMQAIGVHYATPPATMGASTACCMIFITPDGQRSMNTFLGASTDLSTEELDDSLSRDAGVTYLEGYLFDKPPAVAAFIKAAAAAHANGNKVALSLSDPFCVNRHRDAFAKLVSESVDILFANEAEATALYEKNSLEEAIPLLAAACELVVVTRSEQGALILNGGKQIKVAADKVEKVVDTTGAGDLFAAGFLYGYARGFDLEKCGKIGAICAAEVISHVGPRPQTSLADLVKKKLA